jgi:predicted DNA-binding transcriptional regulator YafY
MRYAPAEQLVALLLELGAARAGLCLDDIMERFCVSRRTAERMLAAAGRLTALEEVTAWEDRRKRWRLSRLPPVLAALSVDELAALKLASVCFDRDGLSLQAKALRKLEAKLGSALAAAEAGRFAPDLEALAQAEGFALRPGPRQDIDPTVFDTLRYAIKARRKVRIDYRYRGSGRSGYQTVHPYGFLYGSRHYLVAFSEAPRARDVRMFVLLNIVKATLQAANFVPQANFSLKTFAERSFGVFQERPVKVAWRFSPRAAADARTYVFHPHQSVSEEPDGSVLIEFTAGGLREMCWHLFTWAGEVEIVRPQRLAAMMREELALNARTSERERGNGPEVRSSVRF